MHYTRLSVGHRTRDKRLLHTYHSWIGKLVKNEPGLRSCTPAGIINLLKSQNIKIEGNSKEIKTKLKEIRGKIKGN